MQILRAQARRIAAIAVVVATSGPLLLMEHARDEDLSSLRAQFTFSRHSLPQVAGPPVRQFRSTAPSLQHLAAIMSFLGAGAALSDLDADGLSNDVCYVDTQTDQVIIAPAPGSGERYAPFALELNRDGNSFFDRSRMAPLGCLPGDLDEDGRMDLVVYFAGRTPILFLARSANDGDERLTAQHFVPIELIPGGGIWTTTSATLADLDGDGHLELIIGNYFADGADIHNPMAVSPIFMPESFSRAFNGGGIRIYRCRPDEIDGERTVQCREVIDAFPSELPRGWTLAVGAHDLDGDLLPEIYTANDYGPDRLLWNRSNAGRIRFELVEGSTSFGTQRSRVVGRDSFSGMGVDFGDLNGDGVPDLIVSNITAPLAAQQGQLVYLSTRAAQRMFENGVAHYVEAAESLGVARSGWAWDVRLADFNNDRELEIVQAVGYVKGQINRWPELHEFAMANEAFLANPAFWPALMPGTDISGSDQNPFYVRHGSGYVDISALIGFGESLPSRGIAIGDVDGDGKLDMVVANMWGPSSYYHNECTRCGNFVGLHLRLPPRTQAEAMTVIEPGHPRREMAGRPAIGATVTVTTKDGRQQTRQVDGGNGHSGKCSPDVHFGIGAEEGPVRVHIKWRDPGGDVLEETHHLPPGWHSVFLGSRGSGIGPSQQ